MANTFVNPQVYADLAVQLTTRDLALAATVSRDLQAAFDGTPGTAVNVRVLARVPSHDRALDATTAITIDDLVEQTKQVTLDKRVYSAVRISDEDLTLRIDDFGQRVLRPQTRAVAEAVEAFVVDTMQAGAVTVEALGDAYDPTKPTATFVAARKWLRDRGVGLSRLTAAVGTEVYADLLNADALRDASQAGSNSALAEATLATRLAGFTVVESNELDPGEAIFYAPNAFQLVVRAPVVPAGVAFGQSVADAGFALTWLRDYDSNTLADRSVVSTFVGAQAMDVALDVDGVTPIVPAVRIFKGGEAV